MSTLWQHANQIWLYFPVLRQMIHRRVKKKKGEFQQLSLCFGCEKSSRRADILGYTQLHSEPVTLVIFCPASGTYCRERSLSFWPLSFLVDESNKDIERRTQENGKKNVNQIAHIHVWKRKWIVHTRPGPHNDLHTHTKCNCGSSRITNTNGVKLFMCQGTANVWTRCHRRLHMHDPTWQHMCFDWQVKLKINFCGNISLSWHKGLQCSAGALLIRSSANAHVWPCSLNCRASRSILRKHKDLLCVLSRSSCGLLIPI